MSKYFEINRNGQNVRCKLYANDPDGIRTLVLFGHGFAGHKDNGAAEKFAKRLLSKHKDAAVLIFNLPAHGDDVKKKISLGDCLGYIGIVLEYIRETWSEAVLYSYATSFGGYLILRYISEYGNPFVRIALRCPAVDMYDVLTRSIMTEEERAAVGKGKTVPVGFDRKIDVCPAFLEELRLADIRQSSFLPYADELLILHGTADEVVPFASAKAFAEDNVIDFIPVEGADHRFQDPALMEIATKAVFEFFGF